MSSLFDRLSDFQKGLLTGFGIVAGGVAAYLIHEKFLVQSGPKETKLKQRPLRWRVLLPNTEKHSPRSDTSLERTFIAVKPDGVQRGLIGDIIHRFEQKGYHLVAMKFVTPSPQLAELHYAEHKGKDFYTPLIAFITSGPVVAMVWEGPGVIATGRKLIGATDPIVALPSTIRGGNAAHPRFNIIHGSDSPVSATREIELWFTEEELQQWNQTMLTHVLE